MHFFERLRVHVIRRWRDYRKKYDPAWDATCLRCGQPIRFLQGWPCSWCHRPTHISCAREFETRYYGPNGLHYGTSGGYICPECDQGDD